MLDLFFFVWPFHFFAQIEIEKKERGFSLYVNGANNDRRSSHDIKMNAFLFFWFYDALLSLLISSEPVSRMFPGTKRPLIRGCRPRREHHTRLPLIPDYFILLIIFNCSSSQVPCGSKDTPSHELRRRSTARPRSQELESGLCWWWWRQENKIHHHVPNVRATRGPQRHTPLLSPNTSA